VVEGVAVDSLDQPVAGALVTLRHAASGAEYRAVTDDRGRFRLDAQAASGPFILEVRMLGRRPASPREFRLEVGDLVWQRLPVGEAAARALPAVSVRAPALSAQGPGYIVPDDGIRALPLYNRDFTRLFAAVPQALGRDLNSISGQHPGYNAILVDGATTGDLYGVGRTPGSLAGANAISVEVLDGLRVLVAPFDVREGGFAGGQINAVTRSGGNRFEGSVFTSLQRPFLVGTDTAGRAVNTFDRVQYGVAMGGPIRRDRVHWFLAADVQRSATPFVGPEAGAPGTGISDSIARRAADVFRTVYGFNPGTPDPPVLRQPDANIFTKLSWQGTDGSRVELTHNWVQASSDEFNREVRDRLNRDGWQLSRSGDHRTAVVHATRVHAWTARERWRHEVLAGYETIGERVSSNLNVPLFLVQGDKLGTYLAGGSVVNAQETRLDQRVIELTENSTWTGGRHAITVGGRLQLLHFEDNLFVNQWGVWRFPNVDALERLAPDRYEVNLPLRPGGPLADFNARVLATYVQDRWTPTDRLEVTVGVRVDVPFVDHPLTNPALDTTSVLGHLDTGRFPSGNAVLAPRLGARFDLSGDWRTVLRLGGGGFTGETPFAWMGGAFSNTGLDQQTLICTPTDGVPPPIADVAQRPTRCLNPTSRPVPPSNVVAFSNEFRFPEAEKFVAGIDRSLGPDLLASLDLMLSRTRDAAYLSDVNLQRGPTTAEGRTMYGTISPTGVVIPARLDSRFQQVFFFENRSRDRFRSLTLSMTKRWENGGYAQIGWQWSRTEDLFTVNRNSAILTLQTAPIDGTMAARNLTRSGYDVPQSVTASAAVPLPGGVMIGMLARIQSGRPYAYAVSGDANADGVSSNDLFYVPRSAADISLASPSQYAALDRFIEGEACLRDQRGRIMQRNSCRNPSYSTFDARISWTTPLRAHAVELSADLFNVPRMLNGRWGLIRETSAGEARTGLVTVTGWNAAANRPVYSLITTTDGTVVLPPRNQVVQDASRWRAQLGIRVKF